MTLPWYPRDMGKYARDTAHLSMLEDGAYNNLLDHYYANGGLPCVFSNATSNASLMPDHSRLHRICKASTKAEQEAVDNVLSMFFVLDRDGYYRQSKCDEIILEQSLKHEKRVNAGRKGGEKKASSNATSNASSNTPQKETKTKNIEDTNVSSPPTPKPKISYDDDFEDFWKGWVPYDMDKGSKAQAKKVYEKSRREVTHEIIIGKRDQYLADCHRSQRRTTHASTWLNPTGNRGWADEYQEQSVNNPTGTELSANRGKSKDDRLRDRVHATARQIDDLLGQP